jgi:hypothetical protein
LNFRDTIVPVKKSTAIKLGIQDWLGKKAWQWFSLRLIWGQMEGFDLGLFTERYQLYPLTWYRLGWVDETHVPGGVGPDGVRRVWVLFMTSDAQDEFWEGLCK